MKILKKKNKYLDRYDLVKNCIFSLKMYRLYFFTFLKVFWEVCQCVGTPRYLSWMWCLLCRIRNGFGRFSNDFCCIYEKASQNLTKKRLLHFLSWPQKKCLANRWQIGNQYGKFGLPCHILLIKSCQELKTLMLLLHKFWYEDAL